MTYDEQHWLQEILELESGLTDWELKFAENLDRLPPDHELSGDQADKLREIWDERVMGQ